MSQRPKFSCYNDGVVAIYREVDRRSNFGAKQNVKSIDDMTFIAKLAYAEQSKREQDMEYAEQHGFSLEMKIKTRYLKGVDNKCKAVIDGYLYDIGHVDSTRTEMYLYMQGVDRLATDD